MLLSENSKNDFIPSYLSGDKIIEDSKNKILKIGKP